MHRSFWWESQKERYLDIGGMIILWHVDPLLGNDYEISSYTMAITRQQPINSNRRTVFSVLSVLKCYNKTSWEPVGKNAVTSRVCRLANT
jgi:hypothetical protein